MTASRLSKLAVLAVAAFAVQTLAQSVANQVSQQIGVTQRVPTASASAAVTAKRVIVVSLEDHKLALVEDGQVKKIYPVAVGKPSTPSPVGTFSIERRVMNPTYSHNGRGRGGAGAGQSSGNALDGAEHSRLRNPRDQRAEVDRQGRVAWMHSDGGRPTWRSCFRWYPWATR